MNKNAEMLLDFILDASKGNSHARLNIDELDEDFQPLGKGLFLFMQSVSEYNAFAKALAGGDLHAPLPSRKNEITSSLKSLHASLRHLTWQAQQVAKGDYKHHIDFMGEFSAAFNKMVEQLAERQTKLERLLEAQSNTILELQYTILKTIADLIDSRDITTGGHIEKTQRYLGILINAILQKGLYKEEVMSWNLYFVLQSSQLHDVGKIAIEDSILKKPTKLTEDEFEKIKIHTTFGGQIIEKIKKNTTEHDFLNYAHIFALTHHEKWDGSGYPNGLKGNEIPLLGRVMAIPDVYDALVSARQYKKPFTHNQAVDIICSSSGTHFDPALVELFSEHANEFHEAELGFHSSN